MSANMNHIDIRANCYIDTIFSYDIEISDYFIRNLQKQGYYKDPNILFFYIIPGLFTGSQCLQ